MSLLILYAFSNNVTRIYRKHVCFIFYNYDVYHTNKDNILSLLTCRVDTKSY